MRTCSLQIRSRDAARLFGNGPTWGIVRCRPGSRLPDRDRVFPGQPAAEIGICAIPTGSGAYRRLFSVDHRADPERRLRSRKRAARSAARSSTTAAGRARLSAGAARSASSSTRTGACSPGSRPASCAIRPRNRRRRSPEPARKPPRRRSPRRPRERSRPAGDRKPGGLSRRRARPCHADRAGQWGAGESFSSIPARASSGFRPTTPRPPASIPVN